MIESLIAGVVGAIHPCGITIFLILAGFLLLTALRKNIIKNAISFTMAFFIVVVIYSGVVPGILFLSESVNIIVIILTLVLAIYGLAYFSGYKKTTLTKMNKYGLSFSMASVLGVLSVFTWLPCGLAPIMAGIGTGSLLNFFVYLIGNIVPLVVISLIMVFLGAKNDRDANKIKNLRLIGSIVILMSLLF